MTRGLILSAPASGSGKTTVTLGILRALSRRGLRLRAAKSGPDYIDPRFHAAAMGRDDDAGRPACVNLDAWAMTPARLCALAAGEGLLLIEGAMGLFDGAPPDGKGATGDLARHLGLPVVLIVDAARQSHSVAAVVRGFASHEPAVRVAAVILNNTGSPRHEAMLRAALAPLGLPVLGALRRQAALAHPSRHLGLVQAHERPDLEAFLERTADIVEASLDLEALLALAAPLAGPAATGDAGNGAAPTPKAGRMPPPAQNIAVARDRAFAFAYPHLLADWRAQGSVITFFSPLANEAPPRADMIILPGGYPELHAGRLAANDTFMQSIRKASQTSVIYGECGGYMTLGKGLVDAAGQRHEMAGLLALETSFAQRALTLGYRHLRALGGPFGGRYTAHEFHYASTLSAKGAPLFEATNAEGMALPPAGLRSGLVSGSFAHLIDQVE